MGSPGTGKTLLAKATQRSGRAVLSISGSDFVEMFVGVGASACAIFLNKANMLPVLSLSTIDAVGRHRGAGSAAVTMKGNRPISYS